MRILVLPCAQNISKLIEWLVNVPSIKLLVDPTISVCFDFSMVNGIMNQDPTVWQFDSDSGITMKDVLATKSANAFGNGCTTCALNKKPCTLLVLDPASNPTQTDITALKAQIPTFTK